MPNAQYFDFAQYKCPMPNAPSPDIISSKDSQNFQWTGLLYCDRYSLILLRG
ncbi:hypothetical protein [Calothrix sp. FACHB-168]|uniref:hypothetical protein n=1 Tax=Calothrix sp. FACHB-168 TaxID=2692780 RepID=UPI001688A0DE|nr:hypothetical protein [Calothrix sp. FACHB-168]